MCVIPRERGSTPRLVIASRFGTTMVSIPLPFLNSSSFWLLLCLLVPPTITAAWDPNSWPSARAPFLLPAMTTVLCWKTGFVILLCNSGKHEKLRNFCLKFAILFCVILTFIFCWILTLSSSCLWLFISSVNVASFVSSTACTSSVVWRMNSSALGFF